jgi:hypothetical protein
MMQATTVQPPIPPTPAPVPSTPAPEGGNMRILAPSAGVGPADVYRAMREQRSELSEQLEQLEEKRSDLQRQIQQADDGTEAGLQARIKEIDARISATDAKLAEANAAVATAAAVPGAIVPEPERPERTDPEAMLGIGGSLTVVMLMPIIIAYARRIWRRGATVISPVPQDVRDRLDGLANAVETIGLEVERIGEGQRFMTKVLTESGARGLGQGAAGSIPLPQRDLEQARRSEGSTVR